MFRSDLSWRIWRIFWFAVVAAIFGHAIFTRFSLPQWTFLTNDSGYYLGPALQGRIIAVGPRTIPYPLFCWALLHATGDWRSIAIAQHLLGLLGPALLLLAWFHLGTKIHAKNFARAAHELLGLAIPFLLLPSSGYVVYEQMAMLESFNAFLQCCLGALFCLIWLPAAPRQRILIVCATSFLGVAMYYANPRWGAAAPLTVLVAGIASLYGRDPRRSWLMAAWPILAAAAAWLMIGLPQSRIHGLNPWTKTFIPKVLLWMHADLAAVEFRRDLAASPPPPNAALLRTLEAKIAVATVGEGQSGWVTIPVNADSMMYPPGNADSDLIAAFPNDPDGYSGFCIDYYLRIIRHQPGAFGDRVWTELCYFYTNWGEGPMGDYSGTLTGYWAQSAVVARALAPTARPGGQAPLLQAASRMDMLAARPLDFIPPSALLQADRLINDWFCPLTLWGVVAALVVLVSKRLRSNWVLVVSANLSLTATSILFAQIMTLALVTGADDRYKQAVRSLVVFSVVAAVLLFVNLGFAFGHKLFGRRTQPSGGSK